MQLLENVRRSLPRRAQTGAYSRVHMAGADGGNGRGPGLGGASSITQEVSIMAPAASSRTRCMPFILIITFSMRRNRPGIPPGIASVCNVRSRAGANDPLPQDRHDI
jgi:hypothetical protein